MKYGEEQWKNIVMDHVKSDKFECYNPKTENEFVKILDWLKEWGCSRNLGLGTRVPWDEQFVIESLSDSTIYMAYYTIAAGLQGEDNLDGKKTGPMGIKPESLNVAAYDYIFLSTEFDQSKYPEISQEQLDKLRYEFNFWYPMDMRCSAKDLIRNHLTMSLYNHTAIWPNQPEKWTRSYFCNGYLLRNGEKMSKSLGNFITLRQSLETFGTDATRVALADAGDSLDDGNFEDETANAAILKLFTFESWVKKQLENVGTLDFADNKPENYDTWDKIFVNEIAKIVKLT
jgi:leucyl-tRNA synthetase